MAAMLKSEGTDVEMKEASSHRKEGRSGDSSPQSAGAEGGAASLPHKEQPTKAMNGFLADHKVRALCVWLFR